MVNINREAVQVRFRHRIGPRAGRGDTISVKRLLPPSQLVDFSRRVEDILWAQEHESDHLFSTMTWLSAIPRKLKAKVESKLLQYDQRYQAAVSQPADDLAELLDTFECHRQQSTAKLSTDADVLRSCRRLSMLGSVPLPSIDEGCLAVALDRLSDQENYAANTLAKIAGHWSIFFRWLVDGRVLGRNPACDLKTTFTAREKADVLPEWVDRLVGACTTREEKLWYRVLQWTGCRLGEALSLRLGDVDVSRHSITITDTKRGCVRRNPLYPAIAEYLPWQALPGMRADDLLFPNLSRSSCYARLKRHQSIAGIEPWYPPFNSFRATRANQLAADTTISAVQAGLLMGHSPVVAGRNYHSVDDALIAKLVGA
jgi:site-specific recombinase XerD